MCGVEMETHNPSIKSEQEEDEVKDKSDLKFLGHIF